MRFSSAFATIMLVAAVPSAAATEPAARMAAYNDGVVAIMKAKLGDKARVDRFEVLVRDSYDMAGIAALVVGTKWPAATPTEKQTAIAALTRHSAVSLAHNFVRYGGERFVVDPAVVARGTSSVVKVTIFSTGRSDVLQYRMRQADGEWRVLDVVAQGVSQLAVQRADLAATLASAGIAGLARKLGEIDAKLLATP